MLAEGLMTTTQRQVATMSTLADYKAAEEDRWKVKEQELLSQLGSKSATFFLLAFEGVVKQFALQGYLPPRVSSRSLYCLGPLAEYPSETLDL